jgi:Tetratricopeptide repeat
VSFEGKNEGALGRAFGDVGKHGYLAKTYSKQGRLKEAEDLGAYALEARKKVLGEEHFDMLKSMDTLGEEHFDS